MDVDNFGGGAKTRAAVGSLVAALLKAAEAEPGVKTAILQAANQVPATGGWGL